MITAKVKLTVFFEDPFWVGIFERISDGKLSICKVTFGAEPKDYEVLSFVLSNYNALKFSPELETEIKDTATNPKRNQRSARKQLKASGVGTKSQQAMQLQREQLKTQKKQISREQRQAEKQRKFHLKQQKRKAKRRGH